MALTRVLTAAVFVSLGCVGTVTPAGDVPSGGPPGGGSGSASGGPPMAGSGGSTTGSPTGTGGAGGAATSPADMMMKTANPDLFTLVSKYFPNVAGGTPAKRMVRLTRTQLDATT